MALQPIAYRGELVALAGAERFWLSFTLLARAAGDPERTFVIYMCAYARDVLCGELPGPYSESDAHRYARAALIPERLLERDTLELERVAEALGIPVDELTALRGEA